jgi:hypothetical protein
MKNADPYQLTWLTEPNSSVIFGVAVATMVWLKKSVSLIFEALLQWVLLIEQGLDLEHTMSRFEMKTLNINAVTTKSNSMPSEYTSSVVCPSWVSELSSLGQSDFS